MSADTPARWPCCCWPRHDVGILEFDDRQVVLVAMGGGLTEPADMQASSVIGRAAQIVVARTAAK